MKGVAKVAQLTTFYLYFQIPVLVIDYNMYNINTGRITTPFFMIFIFFKFCYASHSLLYRLRY